MGRKRASPEVPSDESTDTSGSDIEPVSKSKKTKNEGRVEKKKNNDVDDSTDASVSDVEPVSKSTKAKKGGRIEKKKRSESKNASFKGELGKSKYVTISNFRGNKYVDIREWYTDKETDQEKPGKKGISLDRNAWEKLKSLMEEIDIAFDQ